MKQKKTSLMFYISIIACPLFAHGLKDDQFLIAKTVNGIWQYVDAETGVKINYRLYSSNDVKVCILNVKSIKLILISKGKNLPFILTNIEKMVEMDGAILVQGQAYKKVAEWRGAQPILD